MADQILNRGIDDSRMLQIFLDAAHVKVNAYESRKPGLLGTIGYPETGGLACRDTAEALKRPAPQAFIHGRVVE
jgi:hypothetical protein